MSESVTEFENAPVVRWTPLATRNDTNYGQWPEPRQREIEDSASAVLPPFPVIPGEYGLLLTVDNQGKGTLSWDLRVSCDA